MSAARGKTVHGSRGPAAPFIRVGRSRGETGRKFLLACLAALTLLCSIAPSFAQPAPVPALPDTERRTSYSITASTCSCSINFALFGDGTDFSNWLEVFLNGTRVNFNDANFGWAITSPSGSLANLARPITDAVLTFTVPQTGTVQIVGARRPRRTSQFQENQGVPTRNFNVVLSDLTAQNRETWDKLNDVTGRAVLAPAGETLAILQSAATRANQGACFDSGGNLASCTSVPGSTFIAGSGIKFTGSNPTTISFDSSVLATILNAFCTLTPGTCASIYDYGNAVWWGADPTGVADSATAINAALAATNTVVAPPGTFRIASAIKMQPNTRFTCAAGATITQANGANLNAFFDFFTNVPSGSQLDHCTLNGNRANNTNANTILVDVLGVNNINVSYNTITGSSGGAIAASNASFLTFEHNTISNTPNFGIAVINSTSGSRSYAQIRFNTIQGPMFHAVQITQADGNDISGNTLLMGNAIGGPGNGAGGAMQVTISGTTATWVSGTNFAGVTLGEVLVVNGGTEFPIAAVNSNTSLTLTSSGSLTNVAASIGGGDVLSVTNTSFNRLTNNIVSGGVTGGIVLANQGGSIPSIESSLGNIISDNYIENSGNFGIALEALSATSNPQVSQTTITGNIILGPGRSGAASAAPGGIQLAAATNLMIGVLIDGNYVFDPFGVAGGAWVTGSGSANAIDVVFGSNVTQGFANGSAMSGYPTFTSLAAIRGTVASIIDGLAANCGDSACTTWGTNVVGGGGALKLIVGYNGANWTLVGK
jgi:hypothetical protein